MKYFLKGLLKISTFPIISVVICFVLLVDCIQEIGGRELAMQDWYCVKMFDLYNII
jgi:hypothetical protein